jgi:hypothetical protein
MYRPQRYLVRMVLFLVIVGIAVAVLHPRLKDAFLANTVLNGMILGVLLLGIVYIFRQVVSLNPEIGWLAQLKAETSERLIFPESLETRKPPRLLAPMANMLRERKGGRLTLSTTSMRALLDGIGSRIEESHDISRYMIGLLIFLGLLGTFWGLLETVNAVGDTISGLNANGADPAVLFQNLKEGLETPLSGMGTALLFGLAGSLVLGFLELQASQAHNRFVNDLEEWLSSVTRLSSAGPLGEGDQSVPAYIQALLEQTADSLDTMQRAFGRSEEDRGSVMQNLGALTERLGTLSDQMRSEQDVLLRLAEAQSQMQPLLARLSEATPKAAGLDEASRAHLRNLDLRAGQIAQELTKGREHAVQEIRSEIRLLARTIAAIAEEGE